MNRISTHALALPAAFLIGLSATHARAASPGKTQNLTCPGQVPEGLTKSGAAYVFVRSAGVWTQQAYLKAAVIGEDLFGLSVSVSGDTVIVGAPFENSSSTGVNSTPNNSVFDAGAAYVFNGLGPINEGAFAISAMVRSGANLLISFPSMSGKSYTLWRSDTLAPPSWTNTGLTAIPGDGTTKTFTTPAPVAGVPKRFYRVQSATAP